MADIKLTDVLVHIDETLPKEGRHRVEERLRAVDGIISVALHDEHEHLVLVEYNPDVTSSQAILHNVKDMGVHAELIGL